uniref:YggT family protein n=1 Tax=Pleurocladia lacustris TaxID=246121 RepID=A0A1I9LVX8_9PHAE|nr:hypothetical protein [Pleurocladia lacustris]ANS57604.1 hypothetical protein [Pleurocladia lacustris]ANS57748.1 hypothetical protein [Pleurocladia lacustris]
MKFSMEGISIFIYNFVNNRLPQGMVLNALTKRDYIFLTILCTVLFLKSYYWALSVRFLVQWFPNVNPYIHPMFGLIVITDIFLKEFQGLLPNILGMDMSAMLAFVCLEWMIRTLESIIIV